MLIRRTKFSTTTIVCPLSRTCLFFIELERGLLSVNNRVNVLSYSLSGYTSPQRSRRLRRSLRRLSRGVDTSWITPVLRWRRRVVSWWTGWMEVSEQHRWNHFSTLLISLITKRCGLSSPPTLCIVRTEQSPLQTSCSLSSHCGESPQLTQPRTAPIVKVMKQQITGDIALNSFNTLISEIKSRCPKSLSTHASPLCLSKTNVFKYYIIQSHMLHVLICIDNNKTEHLQQLHKHKLQTGGHHRCPHDGSDTGGQWVHTSFWFDSLYTELAMMCDYVE